MWRNVANDAKKTDDAKKTGETDDLPQKDVQAGTGKMAGDEKTATRGSKSGPNENDNPQPHVARQRRSGRSAVAGRQLTNVKVKGARVRHKDGWEGVVCSRKLDGRQA